MISLLRKAWRLVSTTFQEFSDDDCMSMAAALAYYAVFSLPPLLMIVILLVGFFFSPESVENSIQQLSREMIGREGAQQIATMIHNVGHLSSGTLATLVSLAVLAFGATGVLVEVQSALNKIWEVEPDPDQGGLRIFLVKRLFSFAMLVGVALLLLLSLISTILLTAFGDVLSNWFPSRVTGYLLLWLNSLISFGIITLLFAAVYKVVPDAKIHWRDALTGAIVTALLFVGGKYLISLYLARVDVASAYGAAGSLAVFLVWVYYCSLILFLGAEFTQVWARVQGREIEPVEGALRTIYRIHRVRDRQRR